jgi:hypothetical protein
VIAQAFKFNSEDDKIIADKIFYTGFEFVKAAFGDVGAKRDELFPILRELMIKLVKVRVIIVVKSSQFTYFFYVLFDILIIFFYHWIFFLYL